jgi:hypothetical protein
LRVELTENKITFYKLLWSPCAPFYGATSRHDVVACVSGRCGYMIIHLLSTFVADTLWKSHKVRMAFYKKQFDYALVTVIRHA